MVLENLKNQFEQKIKGQENEIVFKNEWNSLMSSLEAKIIDFIKTYKKYIVLDEKALKNKEKSQEFDVVNFSLIENLAGFVSFFQYFDFVEKNINDAYEWNEYERQKYKFNQFLAVYNYFTNNFGDNENDIKAKFQQLKF
ncbi:MAG: hypothetical protein QXD43_04455 [Candidatus Aenigmatarchaeota archaeon]